MPTHQLAPRPAPPPQYFAFLGSTAALAFPGTAGSKELQLGWAAPYRALPNGVLVGAVTACGFGRMLEAAQATPA